MKKTIATAVIAVLVLVLLFGFTGCAKKAAPVQTPAAAPAAPAPAPAPVSDGSQDLKISFQLNMNEADPQNNYLTFAGNVRYLAADKDQYDEVTGASTKGSTYLFNAYLYDVEGKLTMSSGLRGLLLFGNNPWSTFVADNVIADKASDGTITIQFAHRGTAYRIATDTSGNLVLPDGKFESRNIGYIIGGGPQVISKEFSTDGTAATIDWAKVWNSSIAGGKPVDDLQPTRMTGNITRNLASPDSLYYFDGKLKTELNNGILTINGALTAVPRR